MMRVPVVAACALCLLAACSSTKEMKKDSTSMKTDSVAVERWPQSDAKATIDSMAGDLLHGQWLQRWKKDHGGNPTIMIGPIENKIMLQGIDVDLLARDLKRSIVENSSLTDDSIQVIRDKELRCEMRRERSSQCGYSRLVGSEELKLLKERGVDFVLTGEVASRKHEKQYKSGGRPDIDDLPTKYFSYPLHLYLINVERGVKAWLQEKEIETIVHWKESSPRSSEDSHSCDAVARGSQC